MDQLRYVIEDPLWVPVRALFASDDVLHLRTTAVKWKHRWAVWLLCRIVLLSPEERREGKTPPLFGVPSLRYDYL